MRGTAEGGREGFMSRSHGSSFRCLIYDADLNRAANCNGNEDSTGQRVGRDKRTRPRTVKGHVHSQSSKITSFIMSWWLLLYIYISMHRVGV